jgi:hypothetical protein
VPVVVVVETSTALVWEMEGPVVAETQESMLMDLSPLALALQTPVVVVVTDRELRDHSTKLELLVDQVLLFLGTLARTPFHNPA